MPLGSGGGWLQADVVAEGFESGDEAFGGALGVAAVGAVAGGPVRRLPAASLDVSTRDGALQLFPESTDAR
jgi:hypothetical protein